MKYFQCLQVVLEVTKRQVYQSAQRQSASLSQITPDLITTVLFLDHFILFTILLLTKFSPYHNYYVRQLTVMITRP